MGSHNGRAAVLDHSEVGHFADHKIDNTPRVVSIKVTSDPTRGSGSDTYTVGDTTEFTVPFDRGVEVVGDPEFEFSITGGTTDERTYYTGGSGTEALVFSYTVLRADNDPDGIWIGNQDRTFKLDSDDAIRRTQGQRTKTATELLLPTGPQSPRPQPSPHESQPSFRGRHGRRFRKLWARGSRFEQLSGNWESTGPLSRDTWMPQVRQSVNPGAASMASPSDTIAT